MVGGQAADLLAETRDVNLEDIVYIHRHKTADLLICSVRLGALIAGATREKAQHLAEYAKHIGMAFQIQDDILDVVGDDRKLGKQTGRDQSRGKATYISLLGFEKTEQELANHIRNAKEALRNANVEDAILLDLADYMIDRDV